jgi:hypothetical protein
VTLASVLLDSPAYDSVVVIAGSSAAPAELASKEMFVQFGILGVEHDTFTIAQEGRR